MPVVLQPEGKLPGNKYILEELFGTTGLYDVTKATLKIKADGTNTMNIQSFDDAFHERHFSVILTGGQTVSRPAKLKGKSVGDDAQQSTHLSCLVC